jgi:hypothetical protein
MIFDNLLLGPAKLAIWLGEKLVETAHQEMTDESEIRRELLELQMVYELGEVEDQEFERREAALMERLQSIREFKKQQGLV